MKMKRLIVALVLAPLASLMVTGTASAMVRWWEGGPAPVAPESIKFWG